MHLTTTLSNLWVQSFKNIIRNWIRTKLIREKIV